MLLGMQPRLLRTTKKHQGLHIPLCGSGKEVHNNSKIGILSTKQQWQEL